MKWISLCLVASIAFGACKKSEGRKYEIAGETHWDCGVYDQTVPCGSFAPDVPEWIREITKEKLTGYTVAQGPIYSYIGLDYDRDSEWEAVVPIVEKTSKKAGLAILHKKDRSIEVLGAGRQVAGLPENFAIQMWGVDEPGNDQTLVSDDFGFQAVDLSKDQVILGRLKWTGREYQYEEAKPEKH